MSKCTVCGKEKKCELCEVGKQQVIIRHIISDKRLKVCNDCAKMFKGKS
jgi:hypothetical protein